MQLPSNEKNTLGIVQNFVVFQLFIYSPKLFNIEIIISDTLKVIYTNIDEKEIDFYY
jgi:hypothetical protein